MSNMRCTKSQSEYMTDGPWGSRHLKVNDLLRFLVANRSAEGFHHWCIRSSLYTSLFLCFLIFLYIPVYFHILPPQRVEVIFIRASTMSHPNERRGSRLSCAT